MGAGSPVKIGPFTGGLNTYSEPPSIGDDEVVELYNFDIDLDGSVVNRPPVTLTAPGSGGVGGLTYLCTYVATNDAVIFIYSRMAPNLGVVAYNTQTNTWSVVIAGIKCNTAVQYAGKVWVAATLSSAVPGGSWDGAIWASLPAIPRGTTSTIYKERWFIGTGSEASTPSRLLFSNPAAFQTWTGTDTADINNGDGQDIIKIYSFNGYIVIFKSGSTYTFGYDTSPSKGQQQSVSLTIGIANSSCLVEYENNLFVMYGTHLYQINNWNWEQINVKVPFIYYNYSAKTTTENFAISIVGDRLLCRFYDNYFVYGFKTRAFSVWRFDASTYTPSRFIRHPNLDTITGLPRYFSDNYNTASSVLYNLTDTHSAVVGESFTTILTTKTYDFNSPYTFKRLFFWGVDVLGKTSINFRVYPTVYNVPIKWSQLNGRKWSTLKTWRRPIDISVDVTDSAILNNPSGIRSFIKLLKSLRYRQIAFTLTSTVDGSIAQGPYRIFGLTAFTSNKELVSKKVS